MEMINVITLAISLVSVVVSLVVLQKVNKLMTMLRTPIVKKLSSDMNLKPSSKHAVSASEMASRGERKENKQKEQRQASQSAREGQSNNSNGRRDRRNNRNEGRARREVFTPSLSQEKTPVQNMEQGQVPVKEETPVKEQVVQQVRQPLPPRVAPETVPPVQAEPQPAPAREVVEAASAVTPEKVRYGRRNVVHTLPELEEN